MKMACQKDLQQLGLPYPRTCEDCGMGPCKKMPDETRSEVIILKVKKMKLVRHETGVWQVAPDRTAAMVLANHIAELFEGKLPVAETTLGMAIAPLVNQLLDAAAASWPGPKELPGVDVRTLPKLNEDPTA